MARLCPLLNAKIRHTQIEICTISKYLQQNHGVGIYKHVFEHCQILTLHEEQQQQRDITLQMLVCGCKLSY